MAVILYKELSYSIVGLCFEAHNELGRFRNEKTYGDCLMRLFQEHGVRFQREHPLPISFNGERPGRNVPDFIIDNKIVLDLKAKALITKEDYFQMKRYLTASGMRLGIIVNFRQPHIYPKRVAN